MKRHASYALTNLKRGPTQAPPHRTKPEKAWMRARQRRPLHAIEAIVPALVAAVYDEWPDSEIGCREAAWDSYERTNFRLRRKIRNAHAAFLAKVINYALFCVVARELEASANVSVKRIAHKELLAALERYANDMQPEIDAIARFIRSKPAGATPTTTD